jgi:hypothetical protein
MGGNLFNHRKTLRKEQTISNSILNRDMMIMMMLGYLSENDFLSFSEQWKIMNFDWDGGF